MSEGNHTVQDPHSKSIDDVSASLDASDESGLSESEVKKRREAVGPNQLEKHHQRGPLTVLVDQFKSVVIGVMVVALVAALVMREWPEAIAVAAVIVVNTVIGFIAEWRAIQIVDALQKQEETHATVVRGGKEIQVAVRELVPGDRLRIKAGELAPADARLVESKGLRVNEAALTGEAEPVAKDTEEVGHDSPLAERLCMLYKGCSVVDGHGEAVITATGMRTEWEDRANTLAAEGYRVLGGASKEVDSEDAEPYEDLVFSGSLRLRIDTACRGLSCFHTASDGIQRPFAESNDFPSNP
jgi:Ca2+-transporting ATPase